MKSLFSLSLVLILMSCAANQDKEPIKTTYGDTDSMPKSDLYYDTVVHNGISLVQINNGDQPQCLITLSGDTILNEAAYYHRITFPDINEDGYKDIRVFVFSNTPNQSENYFFDNKSSRFLRIRNSNLDIKKVKGTNLFYSYNRAGCADMNWESHLSEINDWKETNIGQINAKGCGGKDDGIYIYKIKNGKETLLETLRIDSILKQSDEKWEFIKHYWAKNYRKFQE